MKNGVVMTPGNTLEYFFQGETDAATTIGGSYQNNFSAARCLKMKIFLVCWAQNKSYRHALSWGLRHLEYFLQYTRRLLDSPEP